MAGTVSLRSSLAEAGQAALRAWRLAPLSCGLLTAAMLIPTLVGSQPISIGLAAPLALGQAAAIIVGWTLLLRFAQDRSGLAGSATDAVKILASILLSSLFLSLIVVVLGVVLLGVAGATGLAEGEDLAMATQAVVVDGGWKTFVLLVLEIAAVLLVLTLSARLMAAGPATVASGRIVSLAALGFTRGSGLRPAAGLLAALAPTILLAASALLLPWTGGWIDWVWAGVLGFIQAPLLAGYATGLWRAASREGESE